MTIRTFRQLGQGYGTAPVNITAKINGSVVFTGDVSTSSESPPPLPNFGIDLGVPVFSWTNPEVTFAGTALMEVTVNNSIQDDCLFYLTDTYANYLTIREPDDTLVHYLGPDYYGGFYYQNIEDPQGEWVSGDPQTEVEIDGWPVEPHPVRTYPGQYYWQLLPQQTLTCVVNIQAGVPIPAEYSNIESYVKDDRVLYNKTIYQAKMPTTGNLPTDTAYWWAQGYID